MWRLDTVLFERALRRRCLTLARFLCFLAKADTEDTGLVQLVAFLQQRDPCMIWPALAHKRLFAAWRSSKIVFKAASTALPQP